MNKLDYKILLEDMDMSSKIEFDAFDFDYAKRKYIVNFKINNIQADYKDFGDIGCYGIESDYFYFDICPNGYTKNELDIVLKKYEISEVQEFCKIFKCLQQAINISVRSLR